MSEDLNLDQGIVEFIDKLIAKILELEHKVQKHEAKFDEIYKGHDDDRRDVLKKRIDDLERRIANDERNTTSSSKPGESEEV